MLQAADAIADIQTIQFSPGVRPVSFRPLTVVLAALAACSLAPLSAHAGCHLIDCLENVDITPADLKQHSCEQLFILRNSAFNQQGYCFRTEKGRKFFSNTGCQFDDIRLVPLNDYQRKNVEVIREVEKKKSCDGAD